MCNPHVTLRVSYSLPCTPPLTNTYTNHPNTVSLNSFLLAFFSTLLLSSSLSRFLHPRTLLILTLLRPLTFLLPTTSSAPP